MGTAPAARGTTLLPDVRQALPRRARPHDASSDRDLRLRAAGTSAVAAAAAAGRPRRLRHLRRVAPVRRRAELEGPSCRWRQAVNTLRETRNPRRHPPLAPVAPAGLACSHCARTFKDDRALRQHAANCRPRARRRVRIQYVHGLEAGPNSFKARCLAKWADVTAPDMATSLWNPFRENAFLRRFLTHISWGAAAKDVLDRCVAIQREALAEPDVLVASSWGAAVALQLLVDRAWTGPTVLLCPGHRRILGAPDADALVAAFRALPKKTLRRVVLVHGDADATVPIRDSRELAKDRARLIEVPGGSHGLGAAAADGLLAYVALEALAKKHGGDQLEGLFLLDGVLVS